MANFLSKRYPRTSIPDLSGKTALITGGSAGFGVHIALGLALSNAKVIIASATEEHGTKAVSEINHALKEEGKTGQVEWFGVDLGSLKQVQSLADRVRQEPRLDLCFWNAGIGVAPFGLTQDGIGNHFAVNHLSHFYLTGKLLPLLRKTASRPDAPPGSVRIVTTSSELHRTAPPDTKFANLQEMNMDIDPNRLYARSKLMGILFTKELVKRHLAPEGNKILAVAIHPGAVATEQQHGATQAYGPLLGKLLESTASLFFKSPDHGAESSLWAGTAPDVAEKAEEYQGAYVQEPYGEPGGESTQAKEAELAERLWVLSEDVLREKGYEVDI